MIHGKFIWEHKELMIAEEIYRRGDSPLWEKDCAKNDSDIIVHGLVYEGADDTCPAGAGCIIIQSDIGRLLKIAVLPEHRGKDYEEFLVRMLIDKAETGGVAQITISCKKENSEFFRKLGFVESERENVPDQTAGVNMIYMANSRKCCAKSI